MNNAISTKLIMHIAVFLVTGCAVFSHEKKGDQNLITSDFPKDNYQIVKIDSVNNIYCIYAKKGDLIYKVLSEKSESGKSNNIVIGKLYLLRLKSLLYQEKHMIYHIGGMKFRGTLIKMDNEPVVRDLFISLNLNGFSYNKR